LPPMGWQKVADNTFARQDEILKIDVREEQGTSYVHVTVTPR
jgi:hypothetical protein